ncbi:hypothetical protein GGR42_002831 [Saonia flava]|uniref:Uncharacterized protein n=1 Tax=Saonia flava TaxID=523696 RepID=A0A846QZJ3_9FLAO|nr:hypothetical protein [Saonia flava]
MNNSTFSIRTVADKRTYISDSKILNWTQKRFELEPEPQLLLYLVGNSFYSDFTISITFSIASSPSFKSTKRYS